MDFKEERQMNNWQTLDDKIKIYQKNLFLNLLNQLSLQILIYYFSMICMVFQMETKNKVLH